MRARYRDTSQKAYNGVSALSALPNFLLAILQLASEDLNSKSTPTSPSKAQHQGRSSSHVPSSLAVASAQCLLRLTEDSPPFVARLTSLPSASALSPLLKIVESSVGSSSFTSEEEREERDLLRIIVAGTLQALWLGSRSSKSIDVPASSLSEIDRLLPDVLLQHLVSSTSLQSLSAEASLSYSSLPSQPTSDLGIAQSSAAGPSAAEAKLESVERRLTTLQLALEILGDWCSTVDGLGEEEEEEVPEFEEEEEEEVPEFEEEEEWEGIPDEEGMDAAADGTTYVNGTADGDDVEMDVIDVAEGLTTNGHDEESPIDQDDMADVLTSPSRQTTGNLSAGLAVFAKLIPLLIGLAQPTAVSFQVEQPAAPTSNTIPTAASSSSNGMASPIPQTVASSLGSIHVRAIEALNNLLISLGRLDESSGGGVVGSFAISQQGALQTCWEGLFGLVDGLREEVAKSSAAKAAKDVKGKGKATAGDRTDPQEELLLAATTGIWTLARLFAAGSGTDASMLVVGEKEVPCLRAVLDGVGNTSEEVATRSLEALGCLARRSSVTIAENEVRNLGVRCLNYVADFGSAGHRYSAYLLRHEQRADVSVDRRCCSRCHLRYLRRRSQLLRRARFPSQWVPGGVDRSCAQGQEHRAPFVFPI